MDMSALGLLIKRCRNKKRISFTMLKNMTGISVMDLKAFEDMQKAPSEEELIKIADALEIPLKELIQDEK